MPDPEANGPVPSAKSLHGLDWLNFFLADVRTGVGPFIAIYLTTNGWNPAQTGLALTAAEISGVITQAPGGALTDRVRSKRLFMAVGLALLTLSALLMAVRPTLPEVISAQLVLGLTGSIFGPGLNAITLGLVGYAHLGARTGRNWAFGLPGTLSRLSRWV
jgi:MFS family permease